MYRAYKQRISYDFRPTTMKLRVLLIVVVTFLCAEAGAQKLYLDTIYVTYNGTSYLVFNQEFDANNDFVDVSSNEYESEIKGNTILVKSAAPLVQPTSFTIKNGGLFYTGFLAYKLNPPITFYDYRNPDAPNFASYSDTSTIELIESGANLDLANSTLNEAMLQALMQRDPDVFTIGVVKAKIVIALSNVMINEGITYLKILVNNKSAKRFDIDFTGFVYSEAANKKDSLKTKGRVMDIAPILQTNVEVVNANQRRHLGYALSLPEVSKQSKLVVTLIERNTSQAISFDIPAEALLRTKLF